MERGYPKDIFVEPIEQYLLCKLCGNVLRSPRTTPCGHVFCQGCIERWVNEYGVCPQRCQELEPQNLLWAVHIETRISGLKTRCQNSGSGCVVQVLLHEKQKHELACPYFHIVGLGVPREPQPRATRDAVEASKSSSERTVGKESLGFFQRTKLVLSFRSAKLARRPTPSNASSPSVAANPPSQSQATGSMLSQRTYRLKRNRPKEPLGLVLLSGDKTSDGRHKSYYVKNVNRDTLGWRAGILAGDRIIKVDNHELWRMTPQESVARIKEKTVVTLTVIRETGNALVKPNHQHIYDEIMYTDLSQQNSQNALSQPHGLSLQGLSQHDENQPPTPPPIMDFGKFSPAAQKPLATGALSTNQEPGHRPQRHLRPTSPTAHLTYRTRSTSGQGERTSKDSGLSSGSSGSPNTALKQTDSKPTVATRLTQAPTPAHDALSVTQNLDKDIKARQSYRTEREMVRTFLKSQRRNSPAPREPVSSSQPARSRNCRIVGDYELEDIYLEKNGTSQLGITLGYDSSAAHGSCLYVCEIVSGGLAALDGRLRTGDIIKRVNGFRVHDPEEAILLFLEQDQDITLSVSRKIKVPSKLRPQPAMDLDYLESTLLRDGHSIRKVDSCGSLDSRTYHHYAILEPPSEMTKEPAIRKQSSSSRELPTLYIASQDSVHESWMLGEDPFDDDQYQSRRSSIPSRSTEHSPLRSGYRSHQMTGSSPNLLCTTSGTRRSPPALSQPMAGSHLLTVSKPASRHNRWRTPRERPASTTPDSKHYRPLGGVVISERKNSTLSSSGTPTTPLDHEPRIMIPPSPTQVPPSFRGLANEIRQLPNRFNNNMLDPSSAGTHGHRESLV